MPDELALTVGDRVVITYVNQTYPSSHSATVIRATPRSFVADYEDGSPPCRYFQRDRRWRSQFGYQVSVAMAKSTDSLRKFAEAGRP